MSVDRSLLPELPGKPEWYLENAPKAVERSYTEIDARLSTPVGWTALPAQTEPGLKADSPLEVPQFPTVGTQPSHGRGFSKVKSLLKK
ncbi:MAG TPA: hypothetical protein VLI04_06035 [Nocardioidaceae bacterium]|nr:hypothetical protein [Nocardioidaceae bacterium]